MSGNFTQVTFNAIHRNLVTLPAESGSATLLKEGNALMLSVSANPMYMPSYPDSSSSLVVQYKVCQVDWFGGCYRTVVPTTQETMRGATANIMISGNVLRKNTKYKVWYQLIRVGSRFYNTSGVEKTTDAVKMK